MTKKMDPKEFKKNQPKPARYGPETKVCAAKGCKTVMRRENFQHHEWLLRKYCSKPCSLKTKSRTWGKFGTGTSSFEQQGPAWRRGD